MVDGSVSKCHHVNQRALEVSLGSKLGCPSSRLRHISDSARTADHKRYEMTGAGSDQSDDGTQIKPLSFKRGPDAFMQIRLCHPEYGTQ